MTDKENSDKATFDGRDRRKKARRLDKDRLDDISEGPDNSTRRKSPGRRAFDRLLHALRLLDQTLKK